MTNLEIKSVVTASSWKYKFAEESEGLDSSPESDIDLKVEGQGDETTCINRTRSEKQNSLCLSFDEASITLHHGRAVRISFDAQWFEPADMSELRIFAIATMNQLVSKIGRPTTMFIKPNDISTKLLIAHEDDQYHYCSIAQWEWKDGRGHKAKRLRSVWVATQRQNQSFRFFVVVEDSPGFDESIGVEG